MVVFITIQFIWIFLDFKLNLIKKNNGMLFLKKNLEEFKNHCFLLKIYMCYIQFIFVELLQGLYCSFPSNVQKLELNIKITIMFLSQERFMEFFINRRTGLY